MRIRELALGLVLVSGVALGAQEPARPTVPQIVTAAAAEVRVSPDKATVSIGVQSRATTAAAAANLNAQKQRAVIDAIKAKGVPAEQISTSNYNVMPETVYDREGKAAPQTRSYLVMNTVNVDLRRIDLVGPTIDAALTAGANQVNSLQFGVQNADSARRAALTQAVVKARADADAIARAAGGSLGSLIEVLATDYHESPPIPFDARARVGVAMGQVAATPVEPGMETIRASVTVRWQFLSRSP
jgi:uncharacterized protein YggE